MSQFNDYYPKPHNQQKNTDLSASASIEAVSNVTHNNGLGPGNTHAHL